MPDITMCANQQCPKREGCYRFKATPSERQSYATFRPESDGICSRFSALSPREIVLLGGTQSDHT